MWKILVAKYLIGSPGLSVFALAAMQLSKQESDFVLSMNPWNVMSWKVFTHDIFPFTVLATEFVDTFDYSMPGIEIPEFLDTKTLEDEELGFLDDGWITLTADVFIQP